MKSTIDSKKFRNACGSFATGITIIGSELDNQIHGMTANGFMSVSLDPPLIVVSIGKNQKMHDIILRSGQYSVSVLSEHQKEISNHFAGQHNPKLKVDFEKKEGIPFLQQNSSYFLTQVVSTHSEGDHTLFVGKVVAFDVQEKETPLLFYKGQYRTLQKEQ